MSGAGRGDADAARGMDIAFISSRAISAGSNVLVFMLRERYERTSLDVKARVQLGVAGGGAPCSVQRVSGPEVFFSLHRRSVLAAVAVRKIS